MNADLTQGIVRILKPDGSTAGTGFVVHASGLITTCAHVVTLAGAGPGQTINIEYKTTGETAHALIVCESWRDESAEDIAVLQLESPLPSDVVVLPLGASHDLGNTSLKTFGFPVVNERGGIFGVCSFTGPTKVNGQELLQLRSNEVSSGFSGAPIWDEQLRAVVGMIHGIGGRDPHNKQSELSFATPIEIIRGTSGKLQLPSMCPYRGLEVFENAHADYYFGRDAAIDELTHKLTQTDFVAVIGVSGAGKSSLVQAGLTRGARTLNSPLFKDRLRCVTKPSSTPILELVLTLSKAIAKSDTRFTKRLAQVLNIAPSTLVFEQSSVVRTLAQIVQSRGVRIAGDLKRAIANQKVLLVIDQFERLFTECTDPNVIGDYCQMLRDLAGSNIKIVIALRADFYSSALQQPMLTDVICHGQMTLVPMNEHELRLAITSPALSSLRSFEPRLVDKLILDVQGRAGNLPLLEYALTELWKRDQAGGVLTFRSYESLGFIEQGGEIYSGLNGAIAQRAEQIWGSLTENEQQAAERLFLSIISRGSDDRTDLPVSDISKKAWFAEWNETTRCVVEKFALDRLLTIGEDRVTKQPTVEIAHEAVLRAWPRLQQWSSIHTRIVHWYSHDFSPMMRLWLTQDKRSDLLLPDDKLSEAMRWLNDFPSLLEGPAATYIHESRSFQEQLNARRRHTVQLRVASVSLVVGLLLILGLLLWSQQRLAEQRKGIVIAHQAAGYAQHLFDEQPEMIQQSLVLATEAAMRLPSQDTRQVLGRVLSVAPRPIAAYNCKSAVLDVDFSSDSTNLVALCENRTLQQWNATTGKRHHESKLSSAANHIVIRPLDGYILYGSGQIDPKGRYVVGISTAESRVRIWDFSNQRKEFSVSHRDCTSASFSSDGRYLLTAGFHGYEQYSGNGWNIRS